MRHSIWKLTALVGISGFGFLVLLQVQKSLHDAGATVQAAEATPETKAAADRPQPAGPTSTPAAGHMAAVPDAAAENPFAALDSPARLDSPAQTEPAGLDFREEVPDEASAAGTVPARTATVPVQTAEAKLEPIPEESDAPAAASDDPFADIRDGGDAPGQAAAETSGPAIQLAGFDAPAKSPAKPATQAEAKPGPEPKPAAESKPAGGASDFGPDPFGDLGPLAPNPHAAGLEESEKPAPPASPGKLLDTEDPFGDAPQSKKPADIPAGDLGKTVPVDGGKAATPAAGPADDNPFGPETGRPEPAAPASPAADDPFGTPAGEPGGATPQPAADAAEAPSEPPAVPDPGFDDPPAGRPAPTPDFGSGAPASEEKPAEDGPRPLPAGDAEEVFDGVGTVSPDAPKGPQRAELTVEKKAPPTATLGRPLVYEITVTNVGDCPAQQVTVSDLIPKGTRLDGTAPQAQLAGQALTWKLGTLGPGQSSKIKVKVIPTEAGPVGSVATVNFVSEVAAKTEVIAPHLSLKIVAPPQAALGQPVDFRFEIANEGTAPAEKVLLRDLLPEGFKHPDGNDLEYEVGTLGPGKTESVTLHAAAVKAGSFKNTAYLTAAGGLKAEAAAEVEVARRNVTVTRQGPKRRFVGRPATYANVVKNTSQQPVSGVRVIEQVPPGMEFVQASHNGQFDPDKRTIAWEVGPLRPGQEQTLQVMLTAAAEGVQDSTVRVEELDGGKVELTSSTAVQGQPSLASAVQTPDGPIAVGERAAVRVRVKNRGTADTRGVVSVSVSIPANLKLVDQKAGLAGVPPERQAELGGRLGGAKGIDVAADPRRGTSVSHQTPIPAGGEAVIDLVVEGAAPGPARLRTSVKADASAEPLVRDEEMVVAPGR